MANKTKNIRQVYEDSKEVMDVFNKIALDASLLTLFESSELGGPIVMDDKLARNWLETNYMHSTSFRPGRFPGVGEIGGDIRMMSDDKKYLVVPFGLLEGATRALTDFRQFEPLYLDWMKMSEQYETEIAELRQRITRLADTNPELAEAKELFATPQGFIGWQDTGLPSERFVVGLGGLAGKLESLANADGEVSRAIELAQHLGGELRKYSSAIPEIAKIRKYHKNIPFIASDGLIRIGTPAASGGLCMHTHPAEDETLMSLPGKNDLFLISAQAGNNLAICHIGGGETQGEHYVMHVPRKYFFKEVQERVDSGKPENWKDIEKIKQEVLERRFPDIISGEILGFRVDGKSRRHAAILNPVVCRSEYQLHEAYLRDNAPTARDFPATEMLLQVGRNDYVAYNAEIRDITSNEINKQIEDSKTGEK